MMIAEDGTFICGDHSGYDQFIYANVPKLKKNMIWPGKYYIQVDPTFNEFAEKSSEYKKVVVDIYCTQSVKLTQVDEDDGINLLAQGLKDVAQNKMAEDQRKYYLDHRPDF